MDLFSTRDEGSEAGQSAKEILEEPLKLWYPEYHSPTWEMSGGTLIVWTVILVAMLTTQALTEEKRNHREGMLYT